MKFETAADLSREGSSSAKLRADIRSVPCTPAERLADVSKTFCKADFPAAGVRKAFGSSVRRLDRTPRALVQMKIHSAGARRAICR